MTEPRRGRGRPPQVPPAPREPIGRDRVAGTRGPRRTPRVTERPERPTFPDDAVIDLPPRIRKEIDRLLGDRDRAHEVKLALSLGTAASEDEDHETAQRYLAWAKHLASRSIVVREAVAIGLYRAGDLRGALTELQAYRRMSGSNDQNHLLADCLRADGRDPERAIEVGLALVQDDAQDLERRIEAAIVVAAVHLDLGRASRASGTLAPFLDGPEAREVPPHALIRLLWMSADVEEAAGRSSTAIAALERLQALDPTYPDVAERLDTLRDRPED